MKALTGRAAQILTMAAMAAVAGCENLGAVSRAESLRQEAKAEAARPRKVEEGTGLLFGSIKSPRIPAGACGMVLWTLSGDQPAPIFRYVSGEVADAVVNGKPTAFELVESAGGSRFGVANVQRFQSETGINAVVRIAFGLGFDGGVYLEDAVITINDETGWRAVTPAAGLAGCRG
ncbi:MAG: hypothetical protein GC152_07325 [Alphaproteobacteria bacterium]|nr:hypothetical protein [Alphaproteobacteria bacterium]